jgi:pyrroline-5-carboxylate reductase
MSETVGVVAMGEMGSAVARRLHERGATVITQLAGRSTASAARAERAGAVPVSTDDEFARQSDFILSIVPPGDAVSLAERLAPAIKRAGRKIIYVDCNAVSPQTAERIGEALKTPAASMWMPASSARRRAIPRARSSMPRARREGLRALDRARPPDSLDGWTERRSVRHEAVLCGHHKGCTAIGPP